MNINIDGDADLKEYEEEITKQIRNTVKIAIKTLEIYWEELQKSNLPDELKKQILIDMGNKTEQK